MAAPLSPPPDLSAVLAIGAHPSPRFGLSKIRSKCWGCSHNILRSTGEFPFCAPRYFRKPKDFQNRRVAELNL